MIIAKVRVIGHLLGSLVDAEDIGLIGKGIILLVALIVVVLTLAGLAGLAVAVFQEARSM